MELDNSDHLQILVAKTWDLHLRISEKINENGFSFCGHCSNHGRYCVVSEGSVEERDKMIAVCDSLRELHHILVYFQRLRSSQKVQRDEAFGRLKESRSILIQRLNQCSEKEKELDIFEEITTFIGEGKRDEFPWKMEEKNSEKNLNWISRFVARFALEFGVIYAIIYGSVKLWKIRQQDQKLRKEEMVGKGGFLLSGADVHLDVLSGRG